MSKTVLIVDDDIGLQETLSAILESEGYEPVMASDGLQAMEKLNQMTPAVVLLDLAMPLMDGKSLVEELERQGRRQQVPIIVITADGRARSKAAAIGADAYVEKPFRIPVLLDEIERNMRP